MLRLFLIPEEEAFLYSKNRQSDPANVLLVGAGALGCAAARTLASAADDGRRVSLTLVDADRVEASNLQRQVLYGNSDLGRLKVEAAAERLAAEFAVPVLPRALRVDAANAAELVAAHDIVLDGTDDPATKFLLNRVCVRAGVPLVHGGVVRTGGQWMLVEPGVSACLSCVFPETAPGGAEGCASLGILAPVAGVIGSMQALAALRRLFQPELSRPGRLFLYELGGRRFRYVDFPPSPDCCCRPGDLRESESAAAAEPFLRRQAS